MQVGEVDKGRRVLDAAGAAGLVAFVPGIARHARAGVGAVSVAAALVAVAPLRALVPVCGNEWFVHFLGLCLFVV